MVLRVIYYILEFKKNYIEFALRRLFSFILGTYQVKEEFFFSFLTQHTLQLVVYVLLFHSYYIFTNKPLRLFLFICWFHMIIIFYVFFFFNVAVIFLIVPP